VRGWTTGDIGIARVRKNSGVGVSKFWDGPFNFFKGKVFIGFGTPFGALFNRFALKILALV